MLEHEYAVDSFFFCRAVEQTMPITTIYDLGVGYTLQLIVGSNTFSCGVEVVWVKQSIGSN